MEAVLIQRLRNHSLNRQGRQVWTDNRRGKYLQCRDDEYLDPTLQDRAMIKEIPNDSTVRDDELPQSAGQTLTSRSLDKASLSQERRQSKRPSSNLQLNPAHPGPVRSTGSTARTRDFWSVRGYEPRQCLLHHPQDAGSRTLPRATYSGPPRTNAYRWGRAPQRPGAPIPRRGPCNSSEIRVKTVGVRLVIRSQGTGPPSHPSSTTSR